MHALSITISGKDMAELHQNITQLLKSISFSTNTVENNENQNSDADVVQNEKKQKRVHKTNTKKTKSESTPASGSEVNTPEEETSAIDVSNLKEEAAQEVYGRSPAMNELAATATQAPLTFADARNALKELVETGDRGTKAGQEILTSFGAQRLSAIKEQDYAAFISKVKEALGKL